MNYFIDNANFYSKPVLNGIGTKGETGSKEVELHQENEAKANSIFYQSLAEQFRQMHQTLNVLQCFAFNKNYQLSALLSDLETLKNYEKSQRITPLKSSTPDLLARPLISSPLPIQELSSPEKLRENGKSEYIEGSNKINNEIPKESKESTGIKDPKEIRSNLITEIKFNSSLQLRNNQSPLKSNNSTIQCIDKSNLKQTLKKEFNASSFKINDLVGKLQCEILKALNAQNAKSLEENIQKVRDSKLEDKINIVYAETKLAEILKKKLNNN